MNFAANSSNGVCDDFIEGIDVLPQSGELRWQKVVADCFSGDGCPGFHFIFS